MKQNKKTYTITANTMAQNNLHKRWLLMIASLFLLTLMATAQNDSIFNYTSLYGPPLDTNVIETSKKMFVIVEYEEGMVIDRVDLITGEKKRILNMDGSCEDEQKDTLKMRGHWSGIEFGLNNLISSSNSFNRPEGYEFMNLDNGKSWDFTINFAQSTTPIIKDHLALIGGLGLDMNHYRFKGHTNIMYSKSTGNIEPLSIPSDNKLKKSKLNVWYLTTPILLETQFGKGPSKDRFYMSAGVIGGIRILSTNKIVQEINGKKHKEIDRNKDLNLNRWRLGATARIGYSDYFDFFATYYFTPFFEKNTQPKLYPLAVGVRIGF